ncbi:MAG: CinA family protein [Gemmatimonadota bacterium]
MNDIADHIVSLSQELGARLQAQHLTIATAESCTAGGIAYAITQTPGSSQWFDRSFITYSNTSKQQMLGVSTAYLRDFGAVSEPVARAMALGALTQSQAQITVAVTGVAGPGGGTPDKPVGMVCFAWAIKRDPASAPWVRTATRQFNGDRASVRTQAIVEALDGLIGLLKQRQDV